MNTVIPAILVHNVRDSRYEIHSEGETVHFGIYDDTPGAINILTSLANDQFETQVVPVNGRQGRAILAATVKRWPHLAPLRVSEGCK